MPRKVLYRPLKRATKVPGPLLVKGKWYGHNNTIYVGISCYFFIGKRLNASANIDIVNGVGVYFSAIALISSMPRMAIILSMLLEIYKYDPKLAYRIAAIHKRKGITNTLNREIAAELCFGDSHGTILNSPILRSGRYMYVPGSNKPKKKTLGLTRPNLLTTAAVLDTAPATTAEQRTWFDTALFRFGAAVQSGYISKITLNLEWGRLGEPPVHATSYPVSVFKEGVGHTITFRKADQMRWPFISETLRRDAASPRRPHSNVLLVFHIDIGVAIAGCSSGIPTSLMNNIADQMQLERPPPNSTCGSAMIDLLLMAETRGAFNYIETNIVSESLHPTHIDELLEYTDNTGVTKQWAEVAQRIIEHVNKVPAASSRAYKKILRNAPSTKHIINYKAFERMLDTAREDPLFRYYRNYSSYMSTATKIGDDDTFLGEKYNISSSTFASRIKRKCSEDTEYTARSTTSTINSQTSTSSRSSMSSQSPAPNQQQAKRRRSASPPSYAEKRAKQPYRPFAKHAKEDRAYDTDQFSDDDDDDDDNDEGEQQTQ